MPYSADRRGNLNGPGFSFNSNAVPSGVGGSANAFGQQQQGQQQQFGGAGSGAAGGSFNPNNLSNRSGSGSSYSPNNSNNNGMGSSLSSFGGQHEQLATPRDYPAQPGPNGMNMNMGGGGRGAGRSNGGVNFSAVDDMLSFMDSMKTE